MLTKKSTKTSREVLISFLQDIGLSEKEAQVYMSLLSFSGASVSSVGLMSGVKRTTVYSIIESLKERGLVYVHIKNFKPVFVAQPPSKLKNLIALRQKQLDQLFPEFESLYQVSESENTIVRYEGIASIESLYYDLLEDMEPHQEYLTFGNPTAWFSSHKKVFQKFMQYRAQYSRKTPFSIRLILQQSSEAQELKKNQGMYNADIRILSTRRTFFTSNLIITPKRLVIHQMVSPLQAIVLANQSVIESHTELFNLLWQEPEKHEVL